MAMLLYLIDSLVRVNIYTYFKLDQWFPTAGVCPNNVDKSIFKGKKDIIQDLPVSNLLSIYFVFSFVVIDQK